MKRIDWNAISDTSLQGYRFGDLVRAWAKRSADEECEHCAVGDCEHNAARTLLALLRIVDHPDDCEECRRIHEERDG